VSGPALPRFPGGFTWGVSTSAYQIEGAAHEDGRGESIWDVFCRKPGAIRDGQNADMADDHYHRWREDVELMARLGVGAYRFSIAWPRVQPTGRGPANAAGLDFYERLTDALLARGITPVPTLYHWDLPQPLQSEGGWLARETAARFADYAGLAAARLADRIPLWITLNEPFVVTAYGYALGFHAPGASLMLDALPTAHHQLLGHGLAAAALRSAGVSQVVITNNYSPAWPASDSEPDMAAAYAYDVWHNRLFTDPVLLGAYPDLSPFGIPGGPGKPGGPAGAGGPGGNAGSAGPGGPGGLAWIRDGDLAVIAAPVDGLGVNYYRPARLSALPDALLPFQMEPIPGYPRTAFGWPVVPAGLTELLMLLKERYGAALPPVYITENGCSADDRVSAGGVVADETRISYLDGHIRAVHEAVAAGVDVRGYFVWSLMDNFEWTEGFHQRFGLVHVDFATQRRTPKDSFGWYRNMIAAQRG